jgi:Ca2+-binding RTX toxin-like protein
MTTAQQVLLDQAFSTVKTTLKTFASQPDALDRLKLAFGSSFSDTTALGIISSIKADNFSSLPSIFIGNSTQLAGQDIAYDAANNQILVFDSFLNENTNRPGSIANLLLEQFGYQFDRVLNGAVNSSLSNGAVFAAVSQAKTLSTVDIFKGTQDDDTLGTADNISTDGDVFIGGTGNDTATLNSDAAGSTIVYVDTKNGTISGGGNIKEVENIVFNGGSGDDNVNAGAAINANLSGGAGNDTLIGGYGNDNLSGGDGNDYLNGGDGTNFLDGGAGNDTFDSGSGINLLAGGTGDDNYGVHNSATRVIEGANEGIDTVWTDVNYVLPDNVENMYLVGSITGTGNDANNTIIAYGAGDKTINGGGGDDMLLGGVGNDTIDGGAGNDIIDGGAGVNKLTGGAGDDNYGVHNTSDVIVENVDGGNDTVWSDAANYTLSANVENMYLVGSVNGTGNDGNNFITGYGVGDNIISGGKGDDTLAGGVGNDTYAINTGTDFGTKTIIENANAGTDTISFAGSSTGIKIDLSVTNTQAVTDKVKLVLPLVNLENVIGGVGDDTIAGNSLNNTLTGGAGADKFVFSGGAVSASTAVSLLLGSDTITDFTTGADKLVLSQATFSTISVAGGAISNFANVADDSLVDGSTAAIVYSQATGKLFYNQNGATVGFGDGGGQFATLSGLPTLAASDFQIV